MARTTNLLLVERTDKSALAFRSIGGRDAPGKASRLSERARVGGRELVDPRAPAPAVAAVCAGAALGGSVAGLLPEPCCDSSDREFCVCRGAHCGVSVDDGRVQHSAGDPPRCQSASRCPAHRC